MAFNFNWSPLTADASFYERARDLLTTALNKSPKPPIIVDDILVDELNLGTEPPDLEILEIGDLAEDRFRGIFKMCYTGNAFLTLRTRVQANPLNTYLYSKPSFTSPQPLAAASGLTIPLSITLSEIKLSAFIILVFSKQKGLTLVFRNDPLESLKVSSTFDSIQFVRDYLQRTIEQQLRNLMMDELPAIIHRLSVQLWCPDQAKQESNSPTDEEEETSIDPFASPPLDPVDTHGNLLDANDISELTLNGGGEVQSLFSQRNLLRLAALTDSHRTLSLFTPGMRDVVFRAWSGYGDRSEAPTPAVSPPSLTKTLSFHAGPSTTYTFSDSGSTTNGYLPSRASQVSLPLSTNGFALGSGHRARPGRKKKTRVVNLRRSRSEVASPECLSEEGSDTASESAPLSEPIFSAPTSDDSQSMSSVPTGSFSAGATSHFEHGHSHHHHLSEHRPSPLSRQPIVADLNQRLEEALTGLPEEHPTEQVSEPATPRPLAEVAGKQPIFTTGASPASLEHAWVSKMAGEIARRFYDEKQRRHRQGVWEGQSETDALPPPTYEAATH